MRNVGVTVIYGKKLYSITIHINKNKFIEKEEFKDTTTSSQKTNIIKLTVFMTPTLKKLKGHVALGLSVHP